MINSVPTGKAIDDRNTLFNIVQWFNSVTDEEINAIHNARKDDE